MPFVNVTPEFITPLLPPIKSVAFHSPGHHETMPDGDGSHDGKGFTASSAAMLLVAPLALLTRTE
jgi:hypothetical protein